MKLQIESTFSIVFLSIINLCVSVQDFAEKTLNSLSDIKVVQQFQQLQLQRQQELQQDQLKRTIGNGVNGDSGGPGGGGGSSDGSVGNAGGPLKWGFENFLLIDYLTDGEMETRISYGGITAKETNIGNSSKSLSLWQLSNGNAFIQMIYSRDDEIIDCEYVRQKGLVGDFLHKFYAEVDQARARNFTTSASVEMFSKPPMVRVSEHDFRRFNEDGIMPDDYYEPPTVDPFGMRNLTYSVVETDADIPAHLRPLMDYHQLKRQCDRRHRQLQQIAHGVRDESSEEKRVAATNQLERRKRALSDWLMAPNTKWCGRGQNAEKYVELGGASKADKCCRRHDHCRFNIPAVSTKWHLFNYRPFTISHCSCDTRFRTCLKMADSSDSIMVGKLFFNIVQTKCFVLKPEKICKKRSWWGQCEKKGIRKRAHLRDNRKF